MTLERVGERSIIDWFVREVLNHTLNNGGISDEV